MAFGDVVCVVRLNSVAPGHATMEIFLTR